jgi:hypothetical protein
MSVRLSVRLKLKISVTAEPNGLYSSGNIPTGPVVVLRYFLGGWDTPNPPKNKKIPPLFFILLCYRLPQAALYYFLFQHLF